MQRSDMRAWARPRAGAALVLVLLLALGAALAARDRLAVAAPPGQALFVSLAGPAGTEIAILDLTTGAELNRVPHPDRAYREISLSPDGRRAAVVRSEPDTLAGQVLEIRSLPDWTLEAVLPLGLQAPPLADLATREPELLANPWLASAAFSADGKLAALAFYGGSGPIPQLIVTAYDLEKRAWASWAKGLGGTSYVWLFPSRERLLVVNRSVLPQWTNSLGDVFALDPQTGRVLAQQAIPRLITAYLPVRGQSAPSMAPGLAAPVLVGNQLWLVTDDLARLILDPRTLEIRSADPPLTRDLAAQFVALAGDWLVAFSTEASALLAIDAASWQLTATHRLPEEGFPYRWHLVGSDPAQHAVYLADIAEGCLWRFQLDSGTLSAPLACGLYLQPPCDRPTITGRPRSPRATAAPAARERPPPPPSSTRSPAPRPPCSPVPSSSPRWARSSPSPMLRTCSLPSSRDSAVGLARPRSELSRWNSSPESSCSYQAPSALVSRSPRPLSSPSPRSPSSEPGVRRVRTVPASATWCPVSSAAPPCSATWSCSRSSQSAGQRRPRRPRPNSRSPPACC
jgi:hypothetical protein